jgi:hypothetical protein
MTDLRIITTAGTNSVLDDSAIEAFKLSLRGELLKPGDADYEQARRIWNGMIDKRPALIARCKSVERRGHDAGLTRDFTQAQRGEAAVFEQLERRRDDGPAGGFFALLPREAVAGARLTRTTRSTRS